MLGVDLPDQHRRRHAIGAPRVVDDRLQHLQQPRFPGPLRGRGDVQVRCAVGGVDRVGMRGPHRHRHCLMVGQHDVAANEGTDRGEQSGDFQRVRLDAATAALWSRWDTRTVGAVARQRSRGHTSR